MTITRPGLGHKVKGGPIGERKALPGVSPSAASTHSKCSRTHMHTHRVRLTRGLPTPRSVHNKTANTARAQRVRPLSEAPISISGARRQDRRAGRAGRNRTKGCFQHPVGQTAAVHGTASCVLLPQPFQLPVNLFWAPGLISLVCKRKLYYQGIPCDSTNMCMGTPPPTGLCTLHDTPALLTGRHPPYTAADNAEHSRPRWGRRC